MGRFYVFAGLLLAEQTAETAQNGADLIHIDLGLDHFHHLLDLVVGQIDADEAFHGGDGILLELGQNVLVGLDLLYDFFHFCFDIHRCCLL